MNIKNPYRPIDPASLTPRQPVRLYYADPNIGEFDQTIEWVFLLEPILGTRRIP